MTPFARGPRAAPFSSETDLSQASSSSSSCCAYFESAQEERPPFWHRAGIVLAVGGLHLLALLLAFGELRQATPREFSPVPSVRVLQLAPREPPIEEARTPTVPSRPARVRPAAVPPAPRKAAVPVPLSSAAPALAAPPAPAVAAQSAAVPLVEASPPPLIAARFDVDYLHNPKPVYPATSRRLNEQGKVVLRVRVSAQGLPLSVEVKQSSGFPRLDEAARTAVEGWRFIPARQGSQMVDSAVLVPLQFTLDS